MGTDYDSMCKDRFIENGGEVFEEEKLNFFASGNFLGEWVKHEYSHDTIYLKEQPSIYWSDVKNSKFNWVAKPTPIPTHYVRIGDTFVSE